MNQHISTSPNTDEMRLFKTAGWLALFIALAAPIGYALTAFSIERNQMLQQVAFTAAEIKSLADAAPETWKQQKAKLAEQFEALSSFQNANLQFVLKDADQRIIIQRYPVSPRTPTYKVGAPIVSATDLTIANLNSITSLRPILFESAVVLMLSIGVALVVFYLFYTVPMRSLRTTKQNLKDAVAALEKEKQEKHNAIANAHSSNEAVKHLTSHDILTDLPNRSFLETKLDGAIKDSIQTGKPFALLLLDMDRFKEINDTLGHHSGDIVIREVSRRITHAAPQHCFIARLGGDEFGVLMMNFKNVDNAVKAGYEILEALEQPFTLHGYNLDTSASLGIAFYPDHGTTADTLMQRADVAMYVAKYSKKDLVVYHPDIDPNSVSLLTLRGELRSAIEQGSLGVHYQPKIDLLTNRISGVEALVRWHHPERGFVSPAHFIPMAEQTGLIHPLTGLVFNIALNQAAQWRNANQHIDVSINISVRSLHDKQLPDRIKEMLQIWGIDPTQLCLELTESAIMAEPERALEILTRLADMGIKLSVDDYGTGYSSLSYIKKLPIQEIKIDRSFVMDMMKNDNDNVIVRATIDMAHDLGLKVTAEGVETVAAWEQLHAYGCDQAQGFYMSKPLPAAEFDAWLRNSKWGNNKQSAS